MIIAIQKLNQNKHNKTGKIPPRQNQGRRKDWSFGKQGQDLPQQRKGHRPSTTTIL